MEPREQDLSPLQDPAKPYISSHKQNNTIWLFKMFVCQQQ